MSKVLSCDWKVSINGRELDNSRRDCIESIDIEELCDGSDTCTINLSDPNFIFIGDNIFVEEAAISITLGWYGDTYRYNFSGYISALDINFPEDGYPVMSIYCLDNSHLMNRKKKSRSWDKVSRADVVKKIAKEYGFLCIVEQGYNFKVEDTISQSNATDIEFCENLAGDEREPFMCKLIGNTLYYVKKGLLKEPKATVYYRKFPYDVVSFSPKINKETIQEEVTVSDIDTTSKTVDTSTANSDNTTRDTQGDPVITKSYTYSPKTGDWKEEVK